MSEPLSPRNPEVAQLRALSRDRGARREAGRFVVEGLKLVVEALASPLTVHQILVAADWPAPEEIEQSGIPIRRLAVGGIERVASTSSPQPVVASVQLPPTEWDEVDTGTAVLVAANVNDPGNVGTLARCAAAAGFGALVAAGNTADPFGPKAVRASAGAIFGLPVVIDRDVAGALDELRRRGVERFGTRMDDAVACDRADLTGPLAFVLGSEAHGLGDRYDSAIDRWVRVPMPGAIESLNVAMAGAILTYEVARQRGDT